MHFRSGTTWILAAATFVAGMFSFASAQAAGWDDVVAAAKKEGSVTVYSGSVGVPDSEAVFKAFEEDYGIKVNLLEARAAELRERLRTELSLGRPSADVVYTSTTMLTDHEKEGALQPFGDIPLLGRLKPDFETDGQILPIAVLTYGLLINTEVIREADAPRSWNDLLDPKWKGKILMDDPRAIGGASLFFTVALDKLGKPFLENLAKQEPTLTREHRQAGLRVARGEYPIYLPLSMADSLKMKGLPIRAYYPKEGAAYITFGAGMIKTAAHPNAARLLINYFLESKSARPFHLNGRAVTFQADTSDLDPDLQALVNGKLMGTQSQSGRDIGLAEAIFK